MKEKQLAEFFVEHGVLQASQAEDVLDEVELNGKTVPQAMIDGGFIDELAFYQTIANGLGTDLIDLNERDIRPEILRLIPSGLARLHGALPVEMSGTTLRVALVDPFDLHAAEDLRFALGKDIHVVVSPADQIEDLIKQHYGGDTTSMEDVLKQLAKETARRRWKQKQTQLPSFALWI
jgi:type IV pilus assembly protein PilB